MSRIRVSLGKRSYCVTCVDNDPIPLREELSKSAHGGRIFVLLDANFYALHGSRFTKSLRPSRKSLHEIVLPSGERHKSQRQLSAIHSLMLEAGIERNDLILAAGGGVTTDIGGFAAASVLRGVRWGAVPTTLLGMVDAAIGGKTGVNHKLGKNLIGAIWQPSFVHCDTYFLHTLPERQILAGCGEILKYAGITRRFPVDTFARYLRRKNQYDSGLLGKLIVASVRCKAKVVGEDEREAGTRMILNYGHTFAHAIESSLGYGRLLHGEAVILGICAALELGRLCGIEKPGSCEEYRRLLSKLVSVVPRRKLSTEDILACMKGDKKRRGERQTFVLLESPGNPQITDRIEKKMVRAAIKEMINTFNSPRNPRG